MHEHVALIALVAIGLHGASLLGDHWLKPGLRGITVPFAMSYRPQFTGVGIIAGYLALLLGPSFYLRRRIGARRWRKLHRMTALVWLLSVLHALGAGSDGSKLWLRVVVLVPFLPIVYLLTLRLLQPSFAISRTTRSEKPHSASAPTHTALASTTAAIMPASDTTRYSGETNQPPRSSLLVIARRDRNAAQLCGLHEPDPPRRQPQLARTVLDRMRQELLRGADAIGDRVFRTTLQAAGFQSIEIRPTHPVHPQCSPLRTRRTRTWRNPRRGRRAPAEAPCDRLPQAASDTG